MGFSRVERIVTPAFDPWVKDELFCGHDFLALPLAMYQVYVFVLRSSKMHPNEERGIS